jgi:hypothetical protein
LKLLEGHSGRYNSKILIIAIRYAKNFIKMKHEKDKILAKFKPFLWSYDLGQIDLEKDKKRIITNVLNLGTKEVSGYRHQSDLEKSGLFCGYIHGTN